MSKITFHSKPACVQCIVTKRALGTKGVSYTIIGLTKDETALEFVRELGHVQAPVVITDDARWSGFRPYKIELLAA